MKKNSLRFAFALLLCALVNSAALADVISKKVTFTQDVKVGETLVKKGDYKVTYDDQSNELTISSGKKVVAKTTARLEERNAVSKQIGSFIIRKGENNDAVLSSVYMGAKYAVISGNGATTVAAPAAAQQ